MSGSNQYIVPTSSGWGVRGEGNSRLTRRTASMHLASFLNGMRA